MHVPYSFNPTQHVVLTGHAGSLYARDIAPLYRFAA